MPPTHGTDARRVALAKARAAKDSKCRVGKAKKNESGASASSSITPKKGARKDKRPLEEVEESSDEEEEEEELGEEREKPCLGCLKSAMRGKSNGACHDTVGKGSRCARCARGKTCRAICHARGQKFLAVLRDRDEATRPFTLDNLRTTLRVLLALEEKKGEEERPAPKKGKKKPAKKAKKEEQEEEEEEDKARLRRLLTKLLMPKKKGGK